MRTSLRMESPRFQKDAIHQKVIPVVYSSFMRGWKSVSRLSPMIMGKVKSKIWGLERRSCWKNRSSKEACGPDPKTHPTQNGRSAWQPFINSSDQTGTAQMIENTPISEFKYGVASKVGGWALVSVGRSCFISPSKKSPHLSFPKVHKPNDSHQTYGADVWLTSWQLAGSKTCQHRHTRLVRLNGGMRGASASLFRHILPTEASSLPNQLCRMWEVVAYKMGYLLVSSPEDP